MSSKIEKTIQRQQQKIAEGQFYEAHQQLRVIAARYVKASNWAAATDILFQGAQSLLQAGQGGSGADLCIFLLEVFHKSETKPDASSKGKLLSLLRAFPKNEPTRKKFVNEMMGWSAKWGDYPAGDPEIHHVAGSLYAEGKHDCTPWKRRDQRADYEAQILSPTMRNVTSYSARKTPLKRLRPSNTHGTLQTIRTQRPSTARGVPCPTSSRATCAQRTSSSSYLRRISASSPASACKRSRQTPPICASTPAYRC